MATRKEIFEAVEAANIDGSFNFAAYLIETGLFDSKEVAAQLMEFYTDQGLVDGFQYADSLMSACD